VHLAGRALVVAWLLFSVVGTVAYWVAFFAAGNALHGAEGDVYLGFERAFPAADAWMAASALAAAVGLLRHRPWSVPTGIAAGSAAVFLGLLDVSFNLEQGLYARGTGAMAVEIAINVLSLSTGPLLILWFWRARHALDPRT